MTLASSSSSAILSPSRLATYLANSAVDNYFFDLDFSTDDEAPSQPEPSLSLLPPPLTLEISPGKPEIVPNTIELYRVPSRTHTTYPQHTLYGRPASSLASISRIKRTKNQNRSTRNSIKRSRTTTHSHQGRSSASRKSSSPSKVS